MMKRASYFQTYKGRKKGGGEFLRHKETGINTEGKKRITLTIQCSTEAPWLWIQRKKERKRQASSISVLPLL
jgi:hypothetical protein